MKYRHATRMILGVLLLCLTCASMVRGCGEIGYDAGPVMTFSPYWTLQQQSGGMVPPCVDLAREQALLAAPMTASLEQRKVDIPVAVLIKFFQDMSSWPTWNILFNDVNMTTAEFQVCSPLRASFHILPAIDFGADVKLAFPTIVSSMVNTTTSVLHYSWSYEFFDPQNPSSPPAFGRHDYYIEGGCGGTDSSTSWLLSFEKAGGTAIDANQKEEEHTLQYATLAAMDGLDCLEKVYAAQGSLIPSVVEPLCGSSPHLRWFELINGGIYV